MKKHPYHDFEPPRGRPSQRARFARKPRGQAAILDDKQVARVEKYIDNHSNVPDADRLKFRLSVYAGLRVGEIAQIQMVDLLQKDGSISPYVRVRAKIAKGNRERCVPMHPKIHRAVELFLLHHPEVPYVAISQRFTRSKRQSLTALTNYFSDLYRKAGLKGFSSHSGRRTFITNLARSMNGTGFTLRDVQSLAGHSRLDTTEKYIGLSGDLDKFIARLR